MGDETGEKGDKADQNDSFQESDSFDEPKGVPISLEPVFSTAGKNIRIDVKQESIDKSKTMLNIDLKPSSFANSFSSPLIRAKQHENKAFVSPFRRDEGASSSSSKKRTATDEGGDYEAPPSKKTPSTPQSSKHESKEKNHSQFKKDMREFHFDVLRIETIDEKEQCRLVLQESSSSPLILGTCSARRGQDIKFGDKIHVDSEVLKKDHKNVPTSIYIEKVIKNVHNGARAGIKRHPIALRPFCRPPQLIDELSNEKVQKAVLQVYILDMNFELYNGCEKCMRMLPSPTRRTRRSECEKCSRSKSKNTIYARMRVTDLSGQLFINVGTKPMDLITDMFEFANYDQWFDFKDPQERKQYVFRPILIEIKRKGKEWDCTDICNVNWGEYNEYLKEKERKLDKEWGIQ